MQGPSRLILIRHAEKTGRRDDPGLSEAGWERARFLAERLPARFGALHGLIAAANKPRTRRPVQTLEPLAARLGLPIEQRPTDAVEALAAELRSQVRYAGGQVLLCWRHDRMARLARALGVMDAPEWNRSVYDAIWIVEPGASSAFRVEDQGFHRPAPAAHGRAQTTGP